MTLDISYPGVHRLNSADDFDDWLRTIQLYAMHEFCHMTLMGAWPEPYRREDWQPPAGEVAGFRPPGAGAVAVHNYGGQFDDTVSLQDTGMETELTQWRDWAKSEMKSRALILGTVSATLHSRYQRMWSSYAMVSAAMAEFGTPTPNSRARLHDQLEALKLGEQPSPSEMEAHLISFVSLVQRCADNGAALPDWQISRRFMLSLDEATLARCRADS